MLLVNDLTLQGGFLYQPKVGVRISRKHDVNAFYTGVAV